MVATIANGRVVSLAGDKDHPYTNGFICRKMRRYPERCYSEERIRYPAIRTGEKGKGEFRRIDWNEALGLLVAKLSEAKQKYGGESILPYAYAGNMGAVNRFAGFPFFNRLGTSRLDQTICTAAAGAGWAQHCGDLQGCPPENAADSDLIVAWGINIRVSNIHFWQYVATARKNGGRLLVIDPYNNATAQSADIYQPVKPAGDAALALGIIKSMLELDLVDLDLLKEKSDGSEVLIAYLRETEWPQFENESGVSVKRIAELARLLAGSAKTFIRIGVGMSRNSRGAMAVRAVTSLGASLGLFSGGKGRGVLFTSGAFKGDKKKLTYPSLALKKTRLVNMIQLGHALTALEPPVKALFVYNANPLSANPDGTTVRKGLAREDLFTVVHEQVLTPTALYADLLLPATTFLENRDVYTSYGHFFMGVAGPVIEPVGEAWSNFDLFQKLARKMGFNDPPFLQSCEERIEDFLQGMEGVPAGTDIPEILSGKIICSSGGCVDNSIAMQNGGRFHFVSKKTDPPSIARLSSAGEYEDPDLLSRFPFRLITPPHADLLNSTFGEQFPDEIGELLIHPEDAGDYSIDDGEEVVIENFRGRTIRRARLTTDTQRGLLVAEGIFWQTVGEATGINDLTSQKLTDLGGGATFHESLVSLVKL